MSTSESFTALDQAFADMQNQSELYKPSAFWTDASLKIATALKMHGVENFRRIDDILAFFVPTYGSPGNSFTPYMQSELTNFFQQTFPDAIKAQKTIELMLGGYQSALADYRVFLAADDPATVPQLSHFSESEFGNPIEHFEFDGKKFSRSSLNYLLGMQLLKRYLDTEINTVLEIGAGFGALGEILAKSDIPNLRYIDVDIPPTSFVAETYLKAALPGKKVVGYMETRHQDNIDIALLPEISVLCSWQLPKLSGSIDLFVNFISFQEMEPSIVKNYFNHVERLQSKWILLRNIREGKQVKKHKDDLGVEQPIRTDDYIDMLPNYNLITRQVYPFGFKTVDNFHSELLLFKRR